MRLGIKCHRLFSSARKCWKCSSIGIIFAIGCRSPFGTAFACQAKPTYTLLLFTQSFLRHPPGGLIELTLRTDLNNAVMVVRDTGIGIPEEHQAKVFERFYRVDEARSRDLGGAGIGLAIACWIVSQHHGQIRLQSSIGAGSTFSVELPLDKSRVCRSTSSRYVAVPPGTVQKG
jgi:Histidine kinase-, DNA gyrase B-, and HSP90-like ATPase